MEGLAGGKFLAAKTVFSHPGSGFFERGAVHRLRCMVLDCPCRISGLDKVVGNATRILDCGIVTWSYKMVELSLL